MQRTTALRTLGATTAVVLLLAASPADAGWTLLQNGYGQDAGYFDISAIDGQHAIAVGTHDRGDGQSESVIAVTTDGTTWTTTRPDGGMPNPMGMEVYTCAEMVTADLAFVGGMGKLLVTTNGGLSWTGFKESDWGFMRGPMISGISFVDADTGILVGSGDVVRKTADAGATWTPLDSPTPGEDLGGVLFQAGNRVWAWGGSSTTDPDTGELTGYEGGLLARSTDGGASWQVVFQGEARAVQQLFMLNTTEGWMVSNSMDGPRFEHTTDGGASWSTQVVPAAGIGPLDTLHDVVFFDRCEGFLLGGAGDVTGLFYTTDRGSSWSQVDLSGIVLDLPWPFPVPVSLMELEFPTRELGFAGGKCESFLAYAADGPGPNCGGSLPGDGGTTPIGGEDGGGCGCRVAGTAGGLAVLPLAALLALRLVRRRRR
jgi:MYXO-CTERM domain-containing protein